MCDITDPNKCNCVKVHCKSLSSFTMTSNDSVETNERLCDQNKKMVPDSEFFVANKFYL